MSFHQVVVTCEDEFEFEGTKSSFDSLFSPIILRMDGCKLSKVEKRRLKVETVNSIGPVLHVGS